MNAPPDHARLPEPWADPEPEQHYGFPWLLLFAGLSAIGVGYAIWRVVG